MTQADVIIIGAGIAGAAVARELSLRARVILLERESQPGYHSTGRSAAAYIPSYDHDNPALRILTRQSYNTLDEPPASFHCPQLLHRRGLLTLYPPGGSAQWESEYTRLSRVIDGLVRLDGEGIRRLVPQVADAYAVAGWLEPEVYDIDVGALHQGYLRDLRARGGRVVTDAEATVIQRQGDGWQVETRGETFAAPLIVNAAGAWADQVGALAGVPPIGLQPLRRTAVLLSPPENCNVSLWPLIVSADDSFYLKPDAGMIMVSPADEHPSDPCDAQPEELDIAYAVHYAEEALQLSVRQVKHSWAGLRSFVADRTPVIGEDPHANGFFWLAAQGGHGIQIGPAAAKLAAALVLGNNVPADLTDAGFEPAWVSPRRLVRGLPGQTVSATNHHP